MRKKWIRRAVLLLLVSVLLAGSALAADLLPQSPLTISGLPLQKLLPGDSFTLTVSGGSGTGEVTWQVVDGPAVITVDGVVTITGDGEVTICVKKAGDRFYTDASATLTFSTGKPAGCTVTFHMTDQDTVVSRTGAVGDRLQVPELPEREGWIFAGWYLDPEYTVQYDLTTPLGGELTLYAKWVPAELPSLPVRIPGLSG